MKITSGKADAKNSRRKVDYSGDLQSVGVMFAIADSKPLVQASFYSDDRRVTVHLTVEELERVYRTYQDMLTKYPDEFKTEAQ